MSDLLRADYTFVNERLARHYGIPGIYGSRFRRVTLPNLESARRPARRTGALLATTSYPGPHVAGAARQVAARQHLRRAGAAAAAGRGHDARQTRSPARGRRRSASGSRSTARNPDLRSCHAVIDPLGFALENFDAIGGWRTVDEAGRPVDATRAR